MQIRIIVSKHLKLYIIVYIPLRWDIKLYFSEPSFRATLHYSTKITFWVQRSNITNLKAFELSSYIQNIWLHGNII